MTGVEEYLETLATVNRHGFGFLLAYGLTWLLAALVWRLWGDRAGACTALVQGMVALPVALVLTAATAVGQRPQDPMMNALSVYLSMGQLAVLPLVIVFIVNRRYTVAVAALATITAVHFVPYAWLYQTPVYVAVALVIAVATAVLVGLEERRPVSSGPLICAATGGALLVGALAAYLA